MDMLESMHHDTNPDLGRHLLPTTPTHTDTANIITKSKMTTFYKFIQLPPECRLIIWEAAIRPNRPAIHHHFINERPPSNFLIDFDQNPVTNFTIHNGNVCEMRSRSVFKWDAGLWLACKESNYVINKHFNPQQWRRRGRRLLPNRTAPNR
ncbi:hypothetical protein NXS19_014138 [Fusarium pseudograminearum]|nr:hypothetical protein NXS19_014138 [Fusarium pseudograminearum]